MLLLWTAPELKVAMTCRINFGPLFKGQRTVHYGICLPVGLYFRVWRKFSPRKYLEIHIYFKEVIAVVRNRFNEISLSPLQNFCQ